MLSIGNQWDSVLREDLQSESFARLQAFLDQEYAARVYSAPSLIL